MIHNRSKRIISTSSEFERLEMVSKPETPGGQQGRGSQGKWIVRSHINWRGERNISYKDMETSP